MNIYTATKWERRLEQRVYNNYIKGYGHRITHDWTVWEDQNPSKDDESRRHAAAMLDFAGVMQADLVIFWDHSEANGERWECGMAVGAGKPVWIVEYETPVVFDVLPQVRALATWGEVFELLVQPNPLA